MESPKKSVNAEVNIDIDNNVLNLMTCIDMVRWAINGMPFIVFYSKTKVESSRHAIRIKGNYVKDTKVYPFTVVIPFTAPTNWQLQFPRGVRYNAEKLGIVAVIYEDFKRFFKL